MILPPLPQTSSSGARPIEAKTLIIAPSARQDLADIYDYIARRDPVRAATFLSEIVARSARTAELGHGGVARDEISPGLRMAQYGRYCGYFRQNDTTMTVLRVLGGGLDPRYFDFDVDEDSATQ